MGRASRSSRCGRTTPTSIARWASDPHDAVPRGRVVQRRPRARCSARSQAIGAHERTGSLRRSRSSRTEPRSASLATRLLALPLEAARHFAQDNAAVNVFEWRGERWVLRTWNDVEALRTGMDDAMNSRRADTNDRRRDSSRASSPSSASRSTASILQTPPRLEMGDLATPLALELARSAQARAARDREGARRRPRAFPPLVASVTVEGAGYLNFRLRPRALHLDPASRRRSLRPPPTGERDHRRAHEHQPEQGRAHRPSAQRRPRRHAGPLPALARASRRDAELHRRHRRAGRRRRRRIRAAPRRGDRAGPEADRRSRLAVRLLLLGPLRAHRRATTRRIPRPSRGSARRCTASRSQEGETARLAALVAEAIVRWHLRTTLRLDIEYDLLVKESDIIRQHFWDRAFELLKESRRGHPRGGREARRLLGDEARRLARVRRASRSRTRSWSARTEP